MKVVEIEGIAQGEMERRLGEARGSAEFVMAQT